MNQRPEWFKKLKTLYLISLQNGEKLYMKRYIKAHPYVLLLAIVAGATGQGVFVFTQFITGNVVDAVAVGDYSAFYTYLGAAVVSVFLIWFFTSVSARLNGLYVYKTRRTLSKDFFEKVLDKKYQLLIRKTVQSMCLCLTMTFQ